MQIEGDPDSPISRGRLCPKGAASEKPRQQPAAGDQGPLPPAARHRVGGARPRHGDGHDRRAVIATRARDLGGPRRRRRPEPHARARFLGGATLDTEENYLIKKCFTALARSRSRTRRAYDTAPRSPVWDLVRRGGATTFQQDLQNSDCIVIMGSNMADSTRWASSGCRGQGARGAGLSRRSALHAHQRHGGPARAAARRHRHRLPGRRDQPHPQHRPRVPRVRQHFTNGR